MDSVEEGDVSQRRVTIIYMANRCKYNNGILIISAGNPLIRGGVR